MAISQYTLGDSETKDAISKMAASVISNIEQNEVAKALSALNELSLLRDQCLYQEVGLLTRALHKSINNLSIDDDGDSRTVANLNYVVEMTDKSANKTMDIIEAGTPIAIDLNNQSLELMEKWQRFRKKEMSLDEFKVMSHEIDKFLSISVSHSGAIRTHFNDILLAQDFQDLTGQVIQRVVNLVTEVESKLVDLVAMAGNVNEMATGNLEQEAITPVAAKQSAPDETATGPTINKTEKAVLHSQDEVDDLLSSLGF